MAAQTDTQTEMTFYDYELLDSLYPVAIIQYRYGSGWIAIADADTGCEHATRPMNRSDWVMNEGPNGNGADLDAHHATAGEEPYWMAFGETSEKALRNLLDKYHDRNNTPGDQCDTAVL